MTKYEWRRWWATQGRWVLASSLVSAGLSMLCGALIMALVKGLGQ